jgi:hypothetical protein
MLKMCPVIPLYVSRCESGTISDDTEITPLARAGIAVCQRPTDVCFFLFSLNFAQPFSIHLERFLGGSIQTKQDGAFGRLRQAS